MPSPLDVEFFKVFDLVDDYHYGVDVNQIDFKRHLQLNIALNKALTMSADGRPLYAEYFYGSTLIAKIYFYFIIDTNGLMTRRTEELHYIKTDDSESDAIRIKDKTYNFANPTDFSLVIAERQEGRSNIINEIKAVLLLTLSAANPTFTIEEVVALGVVFFFEQDSNIYLFVDLGTSDFKDALAAIDLVTTEHDWLNIEVQSSYNLRDFMVDKLTYTSVSNHPDA